MYLLKIKQLLTLNYDLFILCDDKYVTDVRLRGMGSAGARLRGLGRGSLGAGLRGMGRGSAGVR